MPTPTDALGIAHPPATGEERIVSLVPSLTELLFDLGLDGQVVGRTRYCVHLRPAVGAVPAVGGTKKVNRSRLLRIDAEMVSWYGSRAIRGLDYLAKLARRVAEA